MCSQCSPTKSHSEDLRFEKCFKYFQAALSKAEEELNDLLQRWRRLKSVAPNELPAILKNRAFVSWCMTF